MATIKDVSALAGVSIKTVSRVLNGSAEVADATRQRVLGAIADLDYRPSVLAKRLVTGKTHTVGVVIPRSAGYVFSHLYFNEVLRGIGEVLGHHQLDLLLHLAQDDTPYAELYRQQRVDGLILMSIPVDDPHLPGLLDGQVPCVFTCRVAEVDNPTHWVDSDAAAGMEQAVDHLVALGHRRIGFLSGPPNLILARLQEAGFRRAVARHGLSTCAGLVVAGDFSFEAGHRLAKCLMGRDRPPTALVCGDDTTALGAILGVREAGRRVPEDVSVVGFDDIVLARYASPPLTTVHQDGHRKGQLAAQTLVELISGRADALPRQVLLRTELVVRGTTGPASAGGEAGADRSSTDASGGMPMS